MPASIAVAKLIGFSVFSKCFGEKFLIPVEKRREESGEGREEREGGRGKGGEGREERGWDFNLGICGGFINFAE